MPKIIDYFIATRITVSQLEEFVGGLIIHEGWQPIGSPFTSNGAIHQALVKYEE